MTSEKYSPQMSGRTTPIVFVRFVIRLRAAAFGEYRRRVTSASTRSRVSSLTTAVPLTTRETVATETPAACATSRIVTPAAAAAAALRPALRVPGAVRGRRVIAYVTVYMRNATSAGRPLSTTRFTPPPAGLVPRA